MMLLDYPTPNPPLDILDADGGDDDDSNGATEAH